MEIEKVAVANLSFDPSNARKHDEKNLEAIKGSLRKFGQRKPIVVRNDVVIAGNGTLQAALALGWAEIEVVRADDMTNTEATAYALADNRTSELATWDNDVLGKQLSALFEDGFEIGDFGFDLTSLFDQDNHDDELPDDEKNFNKEYKLEIVFGSEDELKPVYEEMLGRGYLAKAKI